jgi:hypothetical protein
VPKQLLLLVASDDVPGCETGLVEQVVEPFGFDVTRVDVHMSDDLGLVPDVEFDYVYICGHANKRSFGGSGEQGDRNVEIEWPALSEAICTKLAHEAVVFLACCHGGLNQVAFDVFIGCDRAETVIGPLSKVDSEVLRLGFHAIIFGLECRDDDPSMAVQRAIDATGKRFGLFEVAQVEVDVNYLSYKFQGGYCEKYPDRCPPIAPPMPSELDGHVTLPAQ